MESLIWWGLLLIFAYKVRTLYVTKKRGIPVTSNLAMQSQRPHLVMPKQDETPLQLRPLMPNPELTQKNYPTQKNNQPVEQKPRPTITNLECGICHTEIRIPIRLNTSTHQCPKCLNPFTTHNTNGVLTAVFNKNMEHINDILQKSGLALTEKDAYAALGVDATSPWSLIEKTRRELLNQYHPDKVDALGPKLKELATAEVTKINLAYAMLKQIKGPKSI